MPIMTIGTEIQEALAAARVTIAIHTNMETRMTNGNQIPIGRSMEMGQDTTKVSGKIGPSSSSRTSWISKMYSKEPNLNPHRAMIARFVTWQFH